MITTMTREAFIADAWQVVGKKVSKERLLSDIYATAVGSVGLPVGPDSDAVRMFRLVLAEGRSLVRQRNEIEARAVELLSDLPDCQLLTSIPGIGQDGAHRTRRGQSRRTQSPLLRGREPRRKDLSLTSRGGSLLTS